MEGVGMWSVDSVCVYRYIKVQQAYSAIKETELI